MESLSSSNDMLVSLSPTQTTPNESKSLQSRFRGLETRKKRFIVAGVALVLITFVTIIGTVVGIAKRQAGTNSTTLNSSSGQSSSTSTGNDFLLPVN